MVTLNIIKRGTTRTLKFQVGTHIYYMGNLIFHQEVIIVNALLALSPLIIATHGRYYYHPLHFTDKENEGHKDNSG